MVEVEKGYVETPEGLVHYVAAGEGSPLLLLHETPRSSVMYTGMIPHLTGFRVIAIDTLGFGNSDPAPDNFTIADYAKNVVSFMGGLGIRRAHIFGDHTGAAIAVETAVGFPDRVDRVILSGLPFWLNEEERVGRHKQALARDLISRAGDGSHLAKIWQYLLGSRIPGGGKNGVAAGDTDLLSEVTGDALKAGAAWKQMEILMAVYDPAPRLPLIKAATLAIGITGEGASIYTKRPREVAALVPSGFAKVMEGVDGRVIYTHGRDVSAIVTEFLQSRAYER